MREYETIKEVVKGDLCTGCGTCIALCPNEAIKPIVSHSTPRNPITFKAFYQKCSIIAPFDLFGVMYETMD
jgi:ferredoxin